MSNMYVRHGHKGHKMNRNLVPTLKEVRKRSSYKKSEALQESWGGVLDPNRRLELEKV